MKKIFLYILLIPVIFVALISNDCWKGSGSDKPYRDVKVYLKPKDIGWHELCGGGTTGSQTIQWNITTTIWAINPTTGKPYKWGTDTRNDIHGTTGDFYVFMKVPQNESFYLEYDLVSTKCYRTAQRATSCPSRCARFSRRQSTNTYNWSNSEIHVSQDDVMWGPCC